MTPLWQRIASGEQDLSQYTDEEILTGQITMADGRKLPVPPSFPDRFLAEQIKRGLVKAERRIREGGLQAIEVFHDIMTDEDNPNGQRMEAARFFTDRFLGSEKQRVSVEVQHHSSGRDPRDILLERLLNARRQLSPEAALQAAQGQPVTDVVDAEIVDDAVLGLDDIL